VSGKVGLDPTDPTNPTNGKQKSMA